MGIELQISSEKMRKILCSINEMFAFQKIMRGTRNINEINYRVQAITINELLGGSTKCNGPPFPRY